MITGVSRDQSCRTLYAATYSDNPKKARRNIVPGPIRVMNLVKHLGGTSKNLAPIRSERILPTNSRPEKIFIRHLKFV